MLRVELENRPGGQDARPVFLVQSSDHHESGSGAVSHVLVQADLYLGGRNRSEPVGDIDKPYAEVDGHFRRLGVTRAADTLARRIRP